MLNAFVHFFNGAHARGGRLTHEVTEVDLDHQLHNLDVKGRIVDDQDLAMLFHDALCNGFLILFAPLVFQTGELASTDRGGVPAIHTSRAATNASTLCLGIWFHHNGWPEKETSIPPQLG
jgi:hypothetical protein